MTPYGDVEGAAYGRGEATVEGDRTAGQREWTNHPRRGEDDVWCPNLTGLLRTDDGAEILI